MRLRAVLQGGRRLQEVLRALERVSKTVTVLMCPAEIAFIANPNAVDSLQVWAVLAAVSFVLACGRTFFRGAEQFKKAQGERNHSNHDTACFVCLLPAVPDMWSCAVGRGRRWGLQDIPH